MNKASGRVIPSFYRIFFTTIDPVIALWGAYVNFSDPNLALGALIANAKRDFGHDLFLHQQAGALLYYTVIDVFLLRYTSDINVWKIVQAGAVLYDFVYIYSVWVVLGVQARLSPDTWRAEDWGSIGIVTFLTLMRLSFLAELGFRSEKTDKKRI